MLKLAVLGALGYFGYRYYQKTQAEQGGAPVSLAGGPLSDQARIQSSPNLPAVSEAGDVVRTTL